MAQDSEKSKDKEVYIKVSARVRPMLHAESGSEEIIQAVLGKEMLKV